MGQKLFRGFKVGALDVCMSRYIMNTVLEMKLRAVLSVMNGVSLQSLEPIYRFPI